MLMQRTVNRLSISATPRAGAGTSISLGHRPQAANTFARATAPARCHSGGYPAAFAGGIASGGGGDAAHAGGGGGSPLGGGAGGFQLQSLPPGVRERLGGPPSTFGFRV